MAKNLSPAIPSLQLTLPFVEARAPPPTWSTLSTARRRVLLATLTAMVMQCLPRAKKEEDDELDAG